MSLLACLGRHTITGLLTTGGRQFADWSADYRLFSRERFDMDLLFGVNRRGVLAELPAGKPFVAAMDDTLLRKSGTKIKGVSYRRDPMGPPFQTNLIRAQRFIQVSAAVGPASKEAPARMVPIRFVHAPTAKKPGKKATEEQKRQYREESRALNLSKQGAKLIRQLRQDLDRDEPGAGRPLWVSVDGSYTNRNVLRDLPDRTTLIGRIRGDAKFYAPWEAEPGVKAGRRRRYGERLPTPERLRQDENLPWQTVEVFAAGKLHDMRIKTVSPVLWRVTGYERPLRLIVIAPLAYRLRKNTRLLYRKPAYLIVTDPEVTLAEAVQAYLWRWDIEVNHRDEKQIIGVGEAQVRSEHSVETAPAFAVATYGMLLLAAIKAFGPNGTPASLPPPKWRSDKPKQRASTADLISQLRCELWGEALDEINFSGFAHPSPGAPKREKSEPDLASAVLYAAA